MNFNIFNSIILAGIVQGLIFGLVVACSKKYRGKSTKFLAAMIVVFSFNNLQYYLLDTGILNSQTFFPIVFIPYQLLAGPLLLFYGISLISPEKKIPKKTFLILMPFIIGFLMSAAYKILYQMGYPAGTWFGFFPGTLELISIILDLNIVLYLLWQIYKMQKKSAEFNLFLISPHLNWFKIILVIFFFLNFLWIYNAIQSFIYNDQTAFYPLWIAISAMIYWLGHVGVYKFGIQEERRKIRNYSIEKKDTYVAGKQKNEHLLSLERILVSEKRFLDAELTLEKIADEINLSKSHLSRIVNNELGTSFTDYINALRVAEAKSYLLNPEFSNYTLVAIGLESGFNSKSAFNSAFKKITSQTPSEFRKSASGSKDFVPVSNYAKPTS